MRKIVNNIWMLVKQLPLTTYAGFVLVLLWFLILIKPIYDSVSLLPGLIFVVFLLNYPLQLVSKFMDLLGMSWLLKLSRSPFVGICIFLLMIDCLVLYIKEKMIHFLNKRKRVSTKKKV